MANRWLDAKPQCYLDFRVNDPARFDVFMHFFTALRAWTQNYTMQTQEETHTSRATAAVSHTSETQESSKLDEDTTAQRRHFGKPEEWLLALRPQDMEQLGLPPHAEAIQALREWRGLSRRERRKAIKISDNREALNVLADFADMLRYWPGIEFELVGCEMQGNDLARLHYVSFGFPFRGKEALEELLMFFGFFSIVHDSCR